MEQKMSIEGAERAMDEMIDLAFELVNEDPTNERHLTLLSDMSLVAAGYVLEYAERATVARVGDGID
jgi:hypothetical protein